MANKRGGKGPLSGNNLLWFGLLAVGAYVGYKYVLPLAQGGNLPEGRVRNWLLGYDNSNSPPKLDKFGREPSKFKIPQTGVNPYSGVSNDGSPTIYQDEWGAIS